MRTLAPAAALALALLGCGPTLTGTPLRIETTGFQVAPYMGCAGVGIAAFRIERDGDSLRYLQGQPEKEIRIRWPNGFVARLQDGRAVLLASDGSVVGHEGEVIDDIGSCSVSDDGTYNA